MNQGVARPKITSAQLAMLDQIAEHGGCFEYDRPGVRQRATLDSLRRRALVGLQVDRARNTICAELTLQGLQLSLARYAGRE